MDEIDYLILGAGLSGLSASYHIGHEKCLLLEKSSHPLGLVYSDFKNGFRWDIGPHVSFTKSDYVRSLFAQSVSDDFYEFEVEVGNYFYGSWIDHPVQANLYQVPEPLRAQCVNSFLILAELPEMKELNNYRDWLESSLGKKITDQFVTQYTKKYWTTEPENLTVDWIGGRVFKPKVEDILNGAKRKPDRSAHYITKVRYPKVGGYQAFSSIFLTNANVHVNNEVVEIDPKQKIVRCTNGNEFRYKKLISTIPLPIFVSMVKGVSQAALDASKELSCTQLLLVNVEVQHQTQRPESWIYVYDEDKYSTRINFTEKMSLQNVPPGMSGIQVEVYFSKYRPLQENAEEIGNAVVKELYEMGLIASQEAANKANVNLRWVPYANIIFDHNRRDALKTIFDEMNFHGLVRRSDELNATTDWENREQASDGDIMLLGRFGEWKYYWSDDSVLCGKNCVFDLE